jgi:hypothetical protein
MAKEQGNLYCLCGEGWTEGLVPTLLKKYSFFSMNFPGNLDFLGEVR